MAVDWNKPVQVRTNLLGSPATWHHAHVVHRLSPPKSDGEVAVLLWFDKADMPHAAAVDQSHYSWVRNAPEKEQWWCAVLQSEAAGRGIYLSDAYLSKEVVEKTWGKNPRLLGIVLVYEREVDA